MEIEFRKFGKEHVDAVLEIEKLSFKEPWTREFFLKEIELPLSNFYVAISDAKIAGYGGFWESGEDADIVNLAVHPDFRNKGLGKNIVRHLLALAGEKGLKRIFLEVRESNSFAQKLYLSCGFRSAGKRKKYYRDEDAILMEKALEKSKKNT